MTEGSGSLSTSKSPLLSSTAVTVSDAAGTRETEKRCKFQNTLKIPERNKSPFLRPKIGPVSEPAPETNHPAVACSRSRLNYLG